jgi:hypothetical protein
MVRLLKGVVVKGVVVKLVDVDVKTVVSLQQIVRKSTRGGSADS